MTDNEKLLIQLGRIERMVRYVRIELEEGEMTKRYSPLLEFVLQQISEIHRDVQKSMKIQGERIETNDE